MEAVLSIFSQGNPGALTFALDMLEAFKEEAILMMARINGSLDLFGSDAYILWNDCCQRDVQKVKKVLDTMSDEDILSHIHKGMYGENIELEEEK